MKWMFLPALVLFGGLLSAQAPAPPQPDNEPAFVKQGHQLMHDGKLSDALGVFQNELKSSPDSHEANIGAGVVLDLMLRGADARKYFEKAIATATDDETKAGANRAMAMSWAFEGNCQMTVQYEQKVLDYAKAKNDFFRAGEIADEEARVCIDTGDFETSSVWYKEGYDFGMKQPNITDAQKDLWNFRWEHAQARLAVRMNEDEDPMKHVAAAKAILDKGNIPEQKAFFPSLTGYVAFYSRDYKTALADFQMANQNDPFIQVMMAQTYEALGQKDQAMDFYRKAAAATAHNPATAYAVPLAKKKLGTN